MGIEIPICEDHEGGLQKEHCWHPNSLSVQALQAQRCCHCGLDFRIQIGGQDHVGKKHGEHDIKGYGVGSYRIVFDTAYRDEYRDDPEAFKRLSEVIDSIRWPDNPRMSGF